MKRMRDSVRKRWLFALVASLASLTTAVSWLVAEDTYPYGSGENVQVGLNHYIERGPAAAMLLAAAVVGIVLAAVGLRSELTGTRRRIVGVGAVVLTVFFAFVLGDGAILPSIGYAVALAAPVAGVVVLVLIGRRWHHVGYMLVVLAVGAILLGAATGVLGPAVETVGAYLGKFTKDPNGYYPRIAWSWGMATVAVCWAWVAVGTMARTRPFWATAEAAQRWGRVATIIAALGPVPYGLARLSWLTPWHLLSGDPDAPGDDKVVLLSTAPIDAATTLQGVMFAGASSVGVVLTLGLISRWGEVFPRWVPALGGHPVPVLLAVIPGGLVAIVLCIAGPGILVGDIESGDIAGFVQSLVFFPFPVWGPALAAAVFAYWLRRSGQRTATPELAPTPA